MSSRPVDLGRARASLRLWPGVVIVALQWLGRFVLPTLVPEAGIYGVFGAFVGGVALLVWWVFFSRAPWSQRIGAVAVMLLALIATPHLLHESLATAGMGILWLVYVVPVLSLSFVVWAAAARGLSERARWLTMVAAVVLACGVWTLVRIGGFTADLNSDFAWRWGQTPEERLLAEGGSEAAAIAVPRSGSGPGGAVAWSGFRGPERNGVVAGVVIETDWTTAPPVELWRRAIGPGWSSFAVDRDHFYTQEQRGEDEVVACYLVETGEPVWMHRDPARFWEANAGAGPRGTPTLRDGRLYAFGATGIINALEARDGSVVWSRDAASDTGAKLPTWGFSSSPLVVDDLVVVAASGKLVAYDRSTGEPRWFGPDGGEGYSSPQLATLDGVPQILQLGSAGLVAVAPADGAVLWEHPWKGYPIVQPAVTSDGGVLISVTSESGTRRLDVERANGDWVVEERWTSRGLKPYFNDLVAHDGHAFGFDGGILAAIDLERGERRWKGGRYGNGQLVLLPDQNLLLVLSESGELALVEAVVEGFREVARFPALEGKTWNHPAVIGDRLLVRNAEEMAAFRLPRVAR